MNGIDGARGGRAANMVDGWYVGEAEFPPHPLERLAYYARLAPSSHNSQPWKFVIGASEIDVFADAGHWISVADRDRREMFLSLGCAIESLRIAADYAGYGSAVRLFPVPGNETFVARVSLRFNGPKRDDAASSLLRHMPNRHTSHRLFDRGRPVSDAQRLALYNCFEAGDVSLHFLHEQPALQRLAALEQQADLALFADAEYRVELAQWISRGVFGASWLLSKLGQFAVAQLPVGANVAHADAERLASAPLVGLLTTRADSRAEQVEAGEAYLRIALMAESLDIRVQPVSQVLEVPATRAALGQLFELHGRVPQHVFRLGHAAAEEQRTQRRPLAQMLVRAPEVPGAGA